MRNMKLSSCAFAPPCDSTSTRQALAFSDTNGGCGSSVPRQKSLLSYDTVEGTTSSKKYSEKTTLASCIATAGEHTTTSPTQHYNDAGHTSCAKVQNSKTTLLENISTTNSPHSSAK